MASLGEIKDKVLDPSNASGAAVKFGADYAKTVGNIATAPFRWVAGAAEGKGGAVGNFVGGVASTANSTAAWALNNKVVRTGLMIGLTVALYKGIKNIFNRGKQENHAGQINQTAEQVEAQNRQLAEMYQQKAQAYQMNNPHWQGGHAQRHGQGAPQQGYAPTRG